MAAVVELTGTLEEPSLIVKWGGMPAAWRWRGTLFELAQLHSQWLDPRGREWYRVESTSGLIFLLCRDGRGWTAALWPGRPARTALAPVRSGRGTGSPA